MKPKKGGHYTKKKVQIPKMNTVIMTNKKRDTERKDNITVIKREKKSTEPKKGQLSKLKGKKERKKD